LVCLCIVGVIAALAAPFFMPASTPGDAASTPLPLAAPTKATLTAVKTWCFTYDDGVAFRACGRRQDRNHPEIFSVADERLFGLLRDSGPYSVRIRDGGVEPAIVDVEESSR
jgi:hypothetical protein